MSIVRNAMMARFGDNVVQILKISWHAVDPHFAKLIRHLLISPRVIYLRARFWGEYWKFPRLKAVPDCNRSSVKLANERSRKKRRGMSYMKIEMFRTFLTTLTNVVFDLLREHKLAECFCRKNIIITFGVVETVYSDITKAH